MMCDPGLEMGQPRSRMSVRFALSSSSVFLIDIDCGGFNPSIGSCSTTFASSAALSARADRGTYRMEQPRSQVGGSTAEWRSVVMLLNRSVQGPYIPCSSGGFNPRITREFCLLSPQQSDLNGATTLAFAESERICRTPSLRGSFSDIACISAKRLKIKTKSKVDRKICSDTEND